MRPGRCPTHFSLGREDRVVAEIDVVDFRFKKAPFGQVFEKHLLFGRIEAGLVDRYGAEIMGSDHIHRHAEMPADVARDDAGGRGA